MAGKMGMVIMCTLQISTIMVSGKTNRRMAVVSLPFMGEYIMVSGSKIRLQAVEI